MSIEDQISALEKERNEFADQFPRLDCLFQAISHSHDGLVGRIRVLESERELWIQRCAEMDAAISDLKTRLVDKEQEICALTSKLSEVQAELKTQQQIAMKERKQLRKLQINE